VSKLRFTDFGWIPDLIETLETKIPVENWRWIDKKLEGDLLIDTETFKIILEPGEVQGHVLVNIAFEKLVNGKFSQDLVINSKNGSKILGAIINGAWDKLEEFDNVEFIVFIAADNVSKRMGIYNTVARRLMKSMNFNIIKDNFKVRNGLMTIISKKNYSDEMLKELEKLQK